MGLFDKKICDICGEKIGLLGNRKLDDGNLCKNCAKKLSPWFEERRHSTVEDIRRQLEYRENNKKAVMDFGITRQISTRNYTVFIDDHKRNFTVARKLDVNENPDILTRLVTSSLFFIYVYLLSIKASVILAKSKTPSFPGVKTLFIIFLEKIFDCHYRLIS